MKFKTNNAHNVSKYSQQWVGGWDIIRCETEIQMSVTFRNLIKSHCQLET